MSAYFSLCLSVFLITLPHCLSSTIYFFSISICLSIGFNVYLSVCMPGCLYIPFSFLILSVGHPLCSLFYLSHSITMSVCILLNLSLSHSVSLCLSLSLSVSLFLTLSLSFSLSHSLSLSFSLSLTHSPALSLSLNIYISLSLSLCLKITLSLSHTH